MKGSTLSKLAPLADRVLVRRMKAEEKTKGGLYLPDVSKEKPEEGVVLAVGPGHRSENGTLIPCALKPGDRVIFGKYAGTEVRVGEDIYDIMREADVYCVIGDD